MTALLQFVPVFPVSLFEGDDARIGLTIYDRMELVLMAGSDDVKAGAESERLVDVRNFVERLFESVIEAEGNDVSLLCRLHGVFS
jgi:hypothetical protein